MDAARKKTLASQLIETASMENSTPIVGMATIKADTMNGARKEPPAEIIRIFLLAEDEGISTKEIWDRLDDKFLHLFSRLRLRK
jgi:hypothetical protein